MPVEDGDALPVAEGEMEPEPVSEEDAVSEALGVLLPEPLRDAVRDALSDVEGVKDGVGVKLDDWVPGGVWGGVPLLVAVCDPVAVKLGVKDVDRVRADVVLDVGVFEVLLVRLVLGVVRDSSGGKATPRRTCPSGAW